MKRYLPFVLFFFAVCTLGAFETKTAVDSNGRTYVFIPGDPFASRVYTLSNGMKLYLSRNTRAPRIQTYIAVRAGSADDPAESTGLAHYFEHMMFKGNERIASLDWTKEKPLLDRIRDLFERRRAESDPEKRAAIYREIDALSGEAAKYSNDEYWQLSSRLGAEGTNAWTSLDETVYVNDIPSSSLEKFLRLESVRFSSIALRRFHTELETVYEEFNMTQDSDFKSAYVKLMDLLFEKHPYGRQVIGLPEHIKNPSMKDIETFFSNHYRPENMALILSGELDYDRTAELAEHYFGAIKPSAPAEKNLDRAALTAAEPVISPVRKADLSGPEGEMLLLAFRMKSSPENEHMLDLISEILMNGKCGLIDKDLVLPQKVLAVQQGVNYFRDFTVHIFIARPRQGQTLDELRTAVLAEIDKLKRGEFPDFLPAAVVNNFRLSLITAAEQRGTAAYAFVDSFIRDYPFADALNAADKMEKISKADITAFAKANYGENYAVVYKHTGKPEHRIKAEKPPIHPVSVPGGASDFAKELLAMPSLPEAEAVFPDYAKELYTQDLGHGVVFYGIRNLENERFSLMFVRRSGSLDDLRLPAAYSLASYLGMGDKSPAELQEALYCLAGGISFSSDYFTSRIVYSGLQRNFDGITKLGGDVRPDETAWTNLRSSILKSRADDRKKQWTVFDHACRYAFYGGLDNLSNHYLPEADLKKLTASELAGLVNSFAPPADIVYYGPEDPAKIAAIFAGNNFAGNASASATAKRAHYRAAPPEKNRVVLIDYPSTQAVAFLLRADGQFEKKPFTFGDLFDEYGRRIFWRELRERRALAYAAGAYYTNPTVMLDDYSSSGIYVLTQPDKLTSAIDAMFNELKNPVSDAELFADSKAKLLSGLRARRPLRENYYDILKDMERRGLSEEVEKTEYNELPHLTPESFAAECKERLAKNPSLLVILGNLKDLDRKALEKYGEITVLTETDIFRK